MAVETIMRKRFISALYKWVSFLFLTCESWRWMNGHLNWLCCWIDSFDGDISLPAHFFTFGPCTGNFSFTKWLIVVTKACKSSLGKWSCAFTVDSNLKVSQMLSASRNVSQIYFSLNIINFSVFNLLCQYQHHCQY